MNTNSTQIINIQNLINASGSVLVIISRPVDPDCVGTGLAVQWWLAQQGKKARVVSFFAIPDTMKQFPDIDSVIVQRPESFVFDDYQALVLVDGSSWGQFLGNNWQQVLKRIDQARIINIDHHVPEEIQAAIPERCLIRSTSSTAQLFYESFLSSFPVTPPARIAEYLYRALLYDTRNFRIDLHQGMYRFADALVTLGADHAKTVDISYDVHEFDFFLWALEHTQYLPDLQATLLAVTDADARELEHKLGAAWFDYDAIYKEVFLRQIAGYNYGLMLVDKRNGIIKLNWRTRNYGDHLSIADIAREAGFRAGGHRNAGGGTFTGTIEQAKTKLLAGLEKAFGQ